MNGWTARRQQSFPIWKVVSPNRVVTAAATAVCIVSLSVVTSEGSVKCQPVLMASSSDIDVLSQPFTCRPDARGVVWRQPKTHTGLMYLQSKVLCSVQKTWRGDIFSKVQRGMNSEFILLHTIGQNVWIEMIRPWEDRRSLMDFAATQQTQYFGALLKHDVKDDEVHMY